MARKTKDLFQLLEKRRSKGSFKVDPDPDPGPPVDVLGAVGGWFSGLLGRSRRPRRRRAAKRHLAARPAGILISGAGLCGIAFASLVVGFLLGQALGSGGQTQLRAGERVAPTWLPGGESAAGELPKYDQQHPLSDYAYLLGTVPIGADPDASRAEAERLATYLRGQGLLRTRIFRYWFESGASAWLTLYYTHGPEIERDVLDRIASVTPPPFAEAGWSRVLERLAEEPRPVSLTPSGK